MGDCGGGDCDVGDCGSGDCGGGDGDAGPVVGDDGAWGLCATGEDAGRLPMRAPNGLWMRSCGVDGVDVPRCRLRLWAWLWV